MCTCHCVHVEVREILGVDSSRVGSGIKLLPSVLHSKCFNLPSHNSTFLKDLFHTYVYARWCLKKSEQGVRLFDLPIHMFGTELGSSRRATTALNHCAVSLGTTPPPDTNRKKEKLSPVRALTIELGTEEPRRKTHQIN